MVIQRRVDGSVDFTRSWNEYRDGLGNLTGELSIGLDKLHFITNSRQHELLIRLGIVNGSTDFVKYDDFMVCIKDTAYLLESIGNHTGSAGDSLNKYHTNMIFLTFHGDTHLHKYNYAEKFGGGWRLPNCALSQLNRRFYKEGKQKDDLYGILCRSCHGWEYNVSHTFVKMMIRPKLCFLLDANLEIIILDESIGPIHFSQTNKQFVLSRLSYEVQLLQAYEELSCQIAKSISLSKSA
ncbi:fibrinogen C domain-containing protein 1-like [Drosophila bipectinata]|uniref:fibrinogen C domain-containing protein 1-like n=1 Tax=Drosophila bipectinata TaxID=42026 RepID=UPI001C8AED8B|nr:fibrinogen C domain-containing protein 1-like [Drosophila bipectinata]